LAKKTGLLVFGTVMLFHLGLVLFTLTASIVFSFVNPPVTTLMVERILVRHYKTKPVLYVPLSKLPSWVTSMYIRVEDKNFYRHQGIDLAAMQFAYEQNERFGRIVAGGSTITQQLVRSLFLVPYRTYPRKYAEVIMSVILDAVMSKHRILELYLNYIEWGEGVYGIGAAVKHHYHKRIDFLTREEFCRLAAIIVNPIDFDVNTFFKQRSMLWRYYALLGADTAPPVPATLEGQRPSSGTESNPSASPTPQVEAPTPPVAESPVQTEKPAGEKQSGEKQDVAPLKPLT